FGTAERDAFMKPLQVSEWTPFREGYDDVLEGRCNRLRNLARRLSDANDPSAMIRVSQRQSEALGRRQKSEAARSLLSEQIEAAEEAARRSDSRRRPSKPSASDLPSVAQGGADRESIDALFTRGDRMRKACAPFGAGALYGPPPSDRDITAWEGEVLAK